MSMERVDVLAARVRELESALERVTHNFRLAVQGKPVRDMAETLAEVDAALAAGGRPPGMWRCECGAEVTTRTCGICGRSPGETEESAAEHRAEYLQDHINVMRRVMQNAGTWDQFCKDYAAFTSRSPGVVVGEPADTGSAASGAPGGGPERG